MTPERQSPLCVNRTQAMLDAVKWETVTHVWATRGDDYESGEYITEESAGDVWRTMIDAGLSSES